MSALRKYMEWNSRTSLETRVVLTARANTKTIITSGTHNASVILYVECPVEWLYCIEAEVRVNDEILG